MKKNDALTASCSTMYARLEFEPRPFGSYEEGGNLVDVQFSSVPMGMARFTCTFCQSRWRKASRLLEGEDPQLPGPTAPSPHITSAIAYN